MRNPFENQAKTETEAFLEWVKTIWGPLIHKPLINSAAIEYRYSNSRSISGWHGQKSRGYGELKVILSIYKDYSKEVLRWELPFNQDVTCFSAEDLKSYKTFLEQARKVVEELG